MILVDIEKIAVCPLCKQANTVPKDGYQHIMLGDWSLAQCLDCGTSFVFPAPDADTLARHYDESYYGPRDSKFIGPVERITWLFRRLRARLIRRFVPEGRVLDMGCGRGIMLKVLKQWGYQVDGIELDTAAALRAEKNIGQKVYHHLDQLAVGDTRQYEVISFWHSLEHLPDPHHALKIAQQLLKPGGILIVAAPNMASVQASLSGKNWLHLDLPRHLTHLDMHSFARFLEEHGYRIIKHSHFSQEYNPIDTLCYIYELIGFGHLYPYRIMTSYHHGKDDAGLSLGKRFLSLLVLPLLTVLAFIAANIFSLVGSGSTSTIICKKDVVIENLQRIACKSAARRSVRRLP
jgi:2-polyprenyl-3-methyl-5-hydroxy-6-metoxy-1,4-benzoquinol methylase